jgi:phytoene dehydrogenase-like protein
MSASPAEPRRRPRARYDVVIVGGGHNGLVAAAYLAAAGRTVLLLERRAELGGAAVSARVFPGHEARLSRYSYLVSLMPALIVRELGLSLRLVRRRVSSYTPDPRAGYAHGVLVDARDRAATAQSLRRATGHADAGVRWERLQAMLRPLAAAVFPTLTEPLPSREQLRRRIGDAAAWRAVFEAPIGETLAAVLADDLVSGIVLTDALIGTFAGAGDADLRQNRCLLYHVIGRGTGEWLVPVGGMGAVSAALVEAARSAGAELREGTEVLALHAQADGVEVRFQDGRGEAAATAGHVLVNAAPAELGRLAGAPAQGGESPEGAQLKVNLLLARLPRLRDRSIPPERAFAGTLHVNETAAQLEAAREQAADGRIPSLPPCETYCHSLTDPSILGPELRAAGSHTLTLFALHMPARLFRADPEGAKRRALAAALDSLQTVLAEPLEDCLLRDPDGAVCVEAHSPLDLERDLRMPGGHIFHRDLAWPFAEGDEQAGTWGVETAHPRVLLCGAGARRGGGVSGVPGRNAAMALLARRS